MWTLGLWCAVFVLSLFAVQAQTENYRLPDLITPIHYELKFRPYLLESDAAKRFTFDGEATIEFQPKVATSTIIMHSKNLNYTSRTLWAANNVSNIVQLTAAELNEVTNKITYNLKQVLEKEQTYFMHFNYTGSMDDDMLGFYRSSYTDAQGQTKWIGSTQFQTNHARRAFPCFDEPRFKATFQVTITRPAFMNTYSNTRPTTQAANDSAYEIDVYEKTPKMSTYLLAFIVSEFKLRGDNTFGVISRTELYDQTEYSYDFGQRSLAELENYFNIKYASMGVNKMHMAAIPDFNAGAMENWGLLTYRERALLYAKNSTTLSSQQYIAQVVAHEQAHQWFGDLVTCDWWSYTWLNEGFARYFQYFATHNLEPTWELDKIFVPAQLQTVMNMDATNSTNPMSDEDTNTEADLSRMFNSISYNKGGTFVRSLHHILGEENLKKALQAYLKASQYTNTKPQQLFDHIAAYWPSKQQAFANLYMHTFTEQVGFPMLSINLANDGKSFTIQQKRFLLRNDGADDSLLYTVPVSYTSDEQADFSKTAPQFFLAPTPAAMIVSLPAKAKWIIANLQQAYYYRVNYDEQTWQAIGKALTAANWSGIHVVNRAQICNDLLNLARANEISYELALPVLEYLSTELSYLPWTAAFNGFSYLEARLGSNTADFWRYIRRLTASAYQQLGFTERASDSPMQILARTSIVSWSCRAANTNCIAHALQLFRSMQQTPVPVNIRSPVYCTAMREGNASDYELLVATYERETSPTELILILSSLGCVRHETLVARQYNFILSGSVRLQDKSSALSQLYTASNENALLVFKLITQNWQRLAEATSIATTASAISSTASYFTQESQLIELQNFNRANKSSFGTSAATLERAEKTVRNNLDWNAQILPSFQQYLQRDVAGSAASIVQGYKLLTLLLIVPLIARFLC